MHCHEEQPCTSNIYPKLSKTMVQRLRSPKCFACRWNQLVLLFFFVFSHCYACHAPKNAQFFYVHYSRVCCKRNGRMMLNAVPAYWTHACVYSFLVPNVFVALALRGVGGLHRTRKAKTKGRRGCPSRCVYCVCSSCNSCTIELSQVSCLRIILLGLGIL